MKEEDEIFCTNCKRFVVAANFATHSAFCQRHITICRVCDEPIQKNLIKEHEDEYHVSVLCDLCKISIEKWILPKHQEVCPRRRVICEFCEGDFPFLEADNHVEFCGSRTEKCSFCSKYIMLKEKKKHVEHHLRKDKVRREMCEGEVDQNIVNELKSKTAEKGIKSYDKISGQKSNEKYNSLSTYDFGSIEGAASHVPDRFKQESEDYTNCHLCRQFILWTDYERHIHTCVPQNESRCPYCEELVPSFALKDHKSISCPMLKDLKKEVKSSESRTDECRSSSNYASDDDMSTKRRPTIQLCPLCNKQCYPDEILEHIKTCPKKFFSCDLCCEKVLLKDKDSHLSSKCKMLHERIPSDLYECPLCSEKLLEKDKTSHESFSCKALLDANEGPLYSLPKEKCSRKPSEEKEKNSTDVCLQCKNRVPKHEQASHKQTCNKNVNKKICAYCYKEIYVSIEDYHLRNVCEVYAQMKTISSDDRGHNGAKPKHSNFSEMIKPKMGKCTYCGTTLNQDILLFHEKECVHQSVKCPDCPKEILLKDIDSHNCKFKRKDKNKGGKKTQKYEKSEPSSTFFSWFSGYNKSTPEAKTLDQYQNERNQVFETHKENKFTARNQVFGTHKENKFTSLQPSNNEYLYFAQPLIDDTNIPCEFCDHVFPASEIILHMTACNPTVSLPKQDSLKVAKEIDSSKHFKKIHDSTTASQNFFSSDRKPFVPSTEYESIHKRVEQRTGTMPGEYLHSTSEMTRWDFSATKKQNQSSSVLTSVWNNDTSDVEMVEADPEMRSSDLIQKVPERENSKMSSDKTEKHSVDSDEEVSNILHSFKGDMAESTNIKLKNCSSTFDQNNLQPEIQDSYSSKNDINDFKRFVSNAANIKSDHHQAVVFSSDEEDFEEINKAYSSKLDTENTVSKDDRNHKKEEPFKNAFRYILKTEIAPDKVLEETLVNTNIVCDKTYSDDDELDHVSKTDKFQSKRNVYRTDYSDCSLPETFDDMKNKQTACDAAETASNLDALKKMKLSNFRFCGNRMQDSFKETEKLKNSEIEEYDVYHKTNALGFVTVSGDEDSVIRRPKRKDVDVACQNKVSRSKFDYQNDNNTWTKQDERNESKIQNVSSPLREKSIKIFSSKCENQNDIVMKKNEEESAKSRTQDDSPYMPEKPFELIGSKCKYLDDDVIQRSQKESFESKTQDVSPSTHEISLEMLKSKYMYQSDSYSEINQIERAKSKTQNVSSSMPEKPFEMSSSKNIYQSDSITETSQKGKVNSRAQDDSPSVHEKPFEKSKYYTVCPMCRVSIRWIDYNTHLPACASASGKCSRCGIKVPSSDLKEHFLVKCSKRYERMESSYDKNVASLQSRVSPYEQVIKSLTSNENIDERKAREQSKNSKMKTSRYEENTDCIESNENSYNSRAKQAFKIEPAKNYLYASGVNDRIGIRNYEESAKEKQRKKEEELSNRYSDEDLEKWCKWRSRTSGDS